MGVPTIFPFFFLNRYLKCSSQVTHVVDQSHLQKVKNFAYASPPTSHEAVASWSPPGTSNSEQPRATRKSTTTFDGSEIQRSPVEVGSLPHYSQGFGIHPNGGWPWDF